MAGAAAALIPRMAGDTRMIAILPRSSVAAVVDLMQGSDRVAGAMVAEDFDATLLSAMATLRMRANLEAKVRVAGAPYCEDLATPLDCVVPPGQHVVELVVAQAPRVTWTVTVKQKDLDVRFELG